MLWNIKKNSENDKKIIIGYSSGKDISCDGIITYDKFSGIAVIEKISASSDRSDSEWLLSHIYQAIKRNAVNEKIRSIALG